MEKYIENIELINKYINQNLTKVEKKAFESRLKTDSEFNELYQEHLVFLEGVKRVSLKSEIQTAKNAYVKAKRVKYIGISTGIILISALVYSLLFKIEEPQLVEPINNAVIEAVSDSIKSTKYSETEVKDKESEVIKTKVVSEKSQKLKTEKVNIEGDEVKESDELEIIDIVEENAEISNPESLSTELITFFNSVKKKPEVFEINTEKEVTITCKEGTKITIPSKSFVNAKTGRLARGKINFEVTEFYKLSDMLLANLSTKSDDELLETGGMLYVEANKKGSKLNLKPGKRIQITFNNSGKKNMKLFSGEENTNGVNWKLEEDTIHFLSGTKKIDSIHFVQDKIIEEDVTVDLKVIEEAPIYPGCENGVREEKLKCLNENITSIIEKNFNKAIAEDLNLIGRHHIKVHFKINKEGEIVDIEALASHTKLAQEAIRVLELVPQMLPAKQRGRTVIIPYYIPIYFSIGKSTKNNPSLIKVKSKTTFERNIENRIEAPIRDSVGLVATTINTNIRDRKDIPISVNEVANYVFTTSQLGWINCDRFVRTKNKFKYKIKLKDANGANVKMVFKSLSSILPSKAIGDEFDFGTIPANEEVTLVAIKESEGKFYLSIKDTATVFSSKVDLEFKEVTIEELKLELQNLNAQFN